MISLIQNGNFYPKKGSTQVNGKPVGGWLSRVLSTYLTAGNSSELLTKHDRRNTCLPEMIEAFSSFNPPPLSYYRCYYKKFPQYSNENTPFYLFVPSPDELELDRQECEKAEEEKRRFRAEAKERRAQEKRLENEIRNQQAAEEVAEEVAEVVEEVAEVVEEVSEDDPEMAEDIFEVVANAEEIIGDNDDLDDLLEDLNGADPALDDILSGLRTRSGRVPRPSTRLRDYYVS